MWERAKNGKRKKKRLGQGDEVVQCLVTTDLPSEIEKNIGKRKLHLIDLTLKLIIRE